MSPSDTLSTGRGALVLYLLQAKERTGGALVGIEPVRLGLGLSLQGKGDNFAWVSILMGPSTKPVGADLGCLQTPRPSSA